LVYHTLESPVSFPHPSFGPPAMFLRIFLEVLCCDARSMADPVNEIACLLSLGDKESIKKALPKCVFSL